MESFSSLRSSFEKFFPRVLDLLYNDVNKEVAVAKEHFLKAAKYNVPQGKKLRGLLCVAAYKSFLSLKEQQQQSNMLETANMVGWCIEVMQAAFLIHDDLMDNSLLRRGQRSWHVLQKEEGKGLIAINDGLHLYMSVQQLLMKLLYKPATETLCLKLVKLFGDYANNVCYGQELDILECFTPETSVNKHTDNTHGDTPPPPAKIKRLSGEMRLQTPVSARVSAIAKWKTSYYSFLLPVEAGMLLAGVKSEILFEHALSILSKIGEYFQAQDDFLDVYGDVAVTGKEGVDIAEGKCSWMLGKAFELASEDQATILTENYGRPEPSCVAAVKAVYDDLDLPTVFRTYEKSIYSEIIGLIDSHCLPGEFCSETDKLPREFFVSVVDMIHQRKK